MSELYPATQNHPIEQLLHTQAVTALAGAINSELKMTVLWHVSPLDSDELVTRFDMKEFLSDHQVDTSTKTGTNTSHLGLILDRLAGKGLLEGSPEEGFRRSLLGTVALGFGGLIFESGFQHNVPMKTLIGEDGQVVRPDGSVRDGIESRLAVWLGLIKAEKQAWIPVTTLLESAEEDFGLQENGVRHAIARVVKAGAVEMRQSPRTKRSKKEVRIRTVEGTRFREAIQDYFGAIGAVATMNQPLLSEGLQTVQRRMKYIASEGLLPIIIRRANVTTPRYGISAVRKRKNS